MDPISLATTVISLVALAGSCLAQCYRYGCTVADAPSECRKLTEELTTLSGVLVAVQAIAQDDAVRGLGPEGYVENLFVECQSALEDSLRQIELAMRVKEKGKGHAKVRTMKLAKQVLWPLRREETLALIAKVERVKTKLSMSMTTVSIQLVLQQQSMIEHVACNVQDIASHLRTESEAAKREKVLNWLTLYDPDTAHQRALRLHCDDTCSWIQQEEAFQQWLNSMKHSGLWLNGLAGYGKTVMTSFVIQNLVDCLDLERVAIAYYYFDASDSESLSLRTFLASIVRQFCARLPSLPERIVKEYDAQQARYGSSRQLGMEELASILDDLLSAQPSNIIVVDGIDESPEQEAICELLNMLVEAGDLVHIFASSRPEAAIRRQLTQFAKIEMTDIALEDDIGRYVRSRMKSEPRLSRLNDGLKQHIQDTIQARSHGMFRWAQCQLDDILKLRTDRAVRKALSVLPQNIGDLYSLMLSRISQADCVLAKRALMIMALSPALMKIDAVAEAAVFDPDQGRIDVDDRLADPADILEICGSLVAFDPTAKEIRLAHHSVRECLERLEPGESMFAMPELHCHTVIAITCLKYLLMDDFGGGIVGTFNELSELLQRFPLLSYAADQVCYHIRKSKCERELQPLILQLFSKEPNPKFMLWLQVVMCWRSSRVVFQIPGSYHIKPQPLYYASSYGLVETVKSLVRAGADLNVRAGRFGGTALHAAFWRGHPEIARFLLESGIDPQIKDLNEMEAMEFAPFQGDPTIVELAIDYDQKNQTSQIPSRLTSAVSQVYAHEGQGSAARLSDVRYGRGRFMANSHTQYWQSQEAKNPQGAENRVFEMG
ncbi:hypothetical protein DV736_g1067, partial [Chaetothyriales sp. CBS 134916]